LFLRSAVKKRTVSLVKPEKAELSAISPSGLYSIRTVTARPNLIGSFPAYGEIHFDLAKDITL
jgi:hypothetical protein